jgi:hypothetical protein
MSATAPQALPSPDVGNDSQTIAVVDDFADAEAIVRKLADANFPVEHTRIVGDNLQLVQRVTGSLTFWGAVGRGAAGGALTGLLIGWIFGLANILVPVVSGLLLALYGVIFGAVVGGLTGALWFSLAGRSRIFLTVSALTPGRCEILADRAWAPEALAILNNERTVIGETPSGG